MLGGVPQTARIGFKAWSCFVWSSNPLRVNSGFGVGFPSFCLRVLGFGVLFMRCLGVSGLDFTGVGLCSPRSLRLLIPEVSFGFWGSGSSLDLGV